MRTALARSADKPQPQPGQAPAGEAMHPLAHLQRAAGNLAMQRVMSGAPLPRELRSSLESYFRTPLDRVRVHNDEASQTLADTLGARALTVGQDIHLGSDGARATGSARNELLAHEVVHTLQQGQAGPRSKLKVGPPDDRFEKQADRLSAGFVHGGHPEAVDHAGGPVIQRAMHPVHYGRFEDHLYGLLHRGGSDIGVEMYLKFHPGPNARADVIALTQVVSNTIRGATATGGIGGVHQATSGAGVGRFVDRQAGFANPLYATEQNPRPGGRRDELRDYPTVPITPLTPADWAADPAFEGQHHDGWGRHGHRRVENGAFVTQAAELYDAPFQVPLTPNSAQVFETAALAVTGLSPTYYGSVEWGWRTDAAGTLTRIPFRVVSQGVPSVNFLTAAAIWNASRADLAYETTAAVTLYDIQPRPGGGTNFVPVASLPVNTRVDPAGREGRVGATAYIEVNHGRDTGFTDAANLRAVAVGAATVDLPVPLVHTVTNPAGSTMLRDATAGPTPANTLHLPRGTRVTTTRCMLPTPTLPSHDEGTVVDGPLIGTHGFFNTPDLTLEQRGTR